MVKLEDLVVGYIYKVKNLNPIVSRDNYECRIIQEYPRFFVLKAKSYKDNSRPYNVCVQKSDIKNGTVVFE